MPWFIDMKKNPAYKVALPAILCALALSLSFIEGMIPPLPFFPPGAKPGFSNIITMFAAGSIGLPTAALIALAKGLFAFVTRGVTAGIMSLSGGLMSALAMFFLIRYAKKILGMVGISAICAVVHNIGQLAAAVFITGTADVIYYLPVLAIFGVITGVLTGIILGSIMPALEKVKKYFYEFK